MNTTAASAAAASAGAGGGGGGKKKTCVRACTLGSAVGLTRQAGELVAVAHPTPKKGYAALGGSRLPAFRSEAASQFSRKSISPGADRTRPKNMFSNLVGRRYGPHPTTSTEAYKGESHVALSDADPDSRQPWQTTNMVFQASAQATDCVGLANAGISSDVARRAHAKQGIYAAH